MKGEPGEPYFLDTMQTNFHEFLVFRDISWSNFLSKTRWHTW